MHISTATCSRRTALLQLLNLDLALHDLRCELLHLSLSLVQLGLALMQLVSLAGKVQMRGSRRLDTAELPDPLQRDGSQLASFELCVVLGILHLCTQPLFSSSNDSHHGHRTYPAA